MLRVLVADDDPGIVRTLMLGLKMMGCQPVGVESAEAAIKALEDKMGIRDRVMNTGTQAAREAGNMIDLDSDPTKLIEIVEIGKQLLITRGALTTFSLANDVAKYFAIIPALFMAALPELGVLNVMHLSTPQSAILSAVIFNALIIILLIPLALKGVRYRPRSTASVLRGNLLVLSLIHI